MAPPRKVSQDNNVHLGSQIFQHQAVDMNQCLINLHLFSARGSPRDLRVFNETISTMKLAWRAAPGNVLQYRIAFKPAEGGERKEISVKGDTTQALLKNLQPATEYELFVSARYSSGLGDPLLGTGTTLEGKGECHSPDV